MKEWFARISGGSAVASKQVVDRIGTVAALATVATARLFVFSGPFLNFAAVAGVESRTNCLVSPGPTASDIPQFP